MDVEWMSTNSLSPVYATSIDGAQTWDGLSLEEDDIMTLGWKIILDDTTPLAHYAGPAFCHATSFRAEGCGLLW
eukprot:8419619-Ditylum_brightwellii.AAC.1